MTLRHDVRSQAHRRNTDDPVTTSVGIHTDLAPSGFTRNACLFRSTLLSESKKSLVPSRFEEPTRQDHACLVQQHDVSRAADAAAQDRDKQVIPSYDDLQCSQDA